VPNYSRAEFEALLERLEKNTYPGSTLVLTSLQIDGVPIQDNEFDQLILALGDNKNNIKTIILSGIPLSLDRLGQLQLAIHKKTSITAVLWDDLETVDTSFTAALQSDSNIAMHLRYVIGDNPAPEAIQALELEYNQGIQDDFSKKDIDLKKLNDQLRDNPSNERAQKEGLKALQEKIEEMQEKIDKIEASYKRHPALALSRESRKLRKEKNEAEQELKEQTQKLSEAEGTLKKISSDIDSPRISSEILFWEALKKAYKAIVVDHENKGRKRTAIRMLVSSRAKEPKAEVKEEPKKIVEKYVDVYEKEQVEHYQKLIYSLINYLLLVRREKALIKWKNAKGEVVTLHGLGTNLDSKLKLAEEALKKLGITQVDAILNHYNNPRYHYTLDIPTTRSLMQEQFLGGPVEIGSFFAGLEKKDKAIRWSKGRLSKIFSDAIRHFPPPSATPQSKPKSE